MSADAPAGEFQHEQLFGYFATEVLEQRSPETQSIIARTRTAAAPDPGHGV